METIFQSHYGLILSDLYKNKKIRNLAKDYFQEINFQSHYGLILSCNVSQHAVRPSEDEVFNPTMVWFYRGW